MHGNVWEWCQDKHGAYPEGDFEDPLNEEGGDARVLRGGSWIDLPGDCRSACRYGGAPAGRAANACCRVVLCLD
jgi:formylglycine-generating enzyme required for sulfatase activity